MSDRYCWRFGVYLTNTLQQLHGELRRPCRRSHRYPFQLCTVCLHVQLIILKKMDGTPVWRSSDRVKDFEERARTVRDLIYVENMSYYSWISRTRGQRAVRFVDGRNYEFALISRSLLLSQMRVANFALINCQKSCTFAEENQQGILSNAQPVVHPKVLTLFWKT